VSSFAALFRHETFPGTVVELPSQIMENLVLGAGSRSICSPPPTNQTGEPIPEDLFRKKMNRAPHVPQRQWPRCASSSFGLVDLALHRTYSLSRPWNGDVDGIWRGE